MKSMSLLLVFLVLLGWTTQAGADRFSAKALPREGKSLSDFVPEGWTVEGQASGDLNGDGIPDIAAILVPSEGEDEFDRAVVILVGRDGKFIPVGTSGKLLECKGCGGSHEMVGISIEKGVLRIVQWMGSRDYAKTIWRFRYDSQTRRLIMIGKDNESGNETKGRIESFNFLTGRKITETFRYDEKGEHKIPTSTKKGEGPKTRPFIEDVEPEF